jgi:hypothetical protein
MKGGPGWVRLGRAHFWGDLLGFGGIGHNLEDMEAPAD